MQTDTEFDGDLLALFDGQSQGTLTQAVVTNGDSLSVTFNGNTAVATRAALTSSFGFADFYSDANDSVRMAQAVAVAETAGGADDVNVVVRMRQVAGADLSLMLYKVDDYNGMIGGVAPGEAGYAALAAAAAYNVQGGGSVIAGPGNGNYSQVQITDVDAGDLIAMQLTNITNGDTFWAFVRPTRWSVAKTSPIFGTTASTPGAGKTCMAAATATSTTSSSSSTSPAPPGVACLSEGLKRLDHAVFTGVLP